MRSEKQTSVARPKREHRYPGARPLHTAESQILVRRDHDIARLEYAIASRQVIEVTAPSGTGKSSLLNAGLQERLKGRYTVVTMSRWAEVAGLEARGLRYYYEAIRAGFADLAKSAGPGEEVIELPDDPYTGLTLLRDTYGKSLVVIFDQLEELMRVNAQIALDFLASVREAAKLFPYRQVLSLRSEYKDQLSELETKLAPTLWQWVRIEELAEGAERDVIRVTHDDAWPIADDVVELIAAAWRAARKDGVRIGLLHLQAMLWVIEDESRRSGLESGWTREGLIVHSPMFRQLAGADSDVESVKREEALTAIVGSSLRRYFEASVDELEEELVQQAGRIPWITGDSGKETRGVIARFVGSLSSAGYKVAQSEDDLFLDAFSEWTGLREQRDAVVALRRLWFTHHKEDLADTDPAVLVHEALDAQPAFADMGLRRNMLNGRLSQSDPLRALAELTVVFERAVSWMASRDIVRITPDFKKNRLVTLIHDGYGESLNTWASETARDPEFFFSALVGSSGTAMLTGADPMPRDQLVTSLRWPGCSIDGVTFENVTFVDCDFRGAVFVFCTFRNVTFRRCYMPGTLFMRCQVEGDGMFFDETVTRTLTMSFTVVAPESQLVFHGVDKRLHESEEKRDGRTPGVDGLVLDGHTGPWTVSESRFRFLMVSGNADVGDTAGPGKILDSQLTLVHFAGQCEPVVVHGDRPVSLIDAPKTVMLDDTGQPYVDRALVTRTW